MKHVLRENSLNEWLLRLFLLASAFFAFSLPLFLRRAMPPFGFSQYEALTIVHELLAGRAWYTTTPYHWVLAAFSTTFPPESAASVISVLLGMVAVLLFSLVLKQFGASLAFQLVAGMLLLLTPATVSLFSSANPNTLALVLFLLGVYLFRRFPSPQAAFPFFILLAFFGFYHLLLGVVMVAAAVMGKKRHTTVLFGVLFLYVFFSFFSFLSLSSLAIPVSGILSDFGGLGGLGIFNALLMMIGVIVLWRKRFMMTELFATLLFVLGSLFIFGPLVVPYLGFFAALLGAFACLSLVKVNWEVGAIRNLTLMVLLYGLLFSSLSHYGRIVESPPSLAVVESLQSFENLSHGRVLSAPSRGFWIEYYGHMPAVVTPRSSLAEKEKVTRIFSFRNIDRARSALTELDVSYIWIDTAMKTGDVWTEPDEGLLFLFRNNETFLKREEAGAAELWQVLR